MKYISFVVDRNPLYYYQAQLLLHSLVNNTEFSKENIIVQCIHGVDSYFLDYLEKGGFTYTQIAPYLDNAYCNKLAQLAYFRDKEIQSVILLDTDTYVLDNALFMLDNPCVMGKVVDAPNPPLPIIENIFSNAKIALPSTILTDWDFTEGTTIEGNFNGGFYYIPGSYVPQLDNEWKKWAEWLYAHRELFQNDAYAIHVDQISFAMALKAGSIPYGFLETNYNFPTHLQRQPRYFNKNEPVHLIHYHRQLNIFGLMDMSQIALPEVAEAVNNANAQIAKMDNIEMYYRYRKSSVAAQSHTLSANITEKVEHAFIQYGNLTCYLHVGTPKTATTTLQYICAENADYLKFKGILYPDNYTQNSVPKHQWLVPLLLSGNIDELHNKFLEIMQKAQKNNCHAVFLSTEGIFNHWWDFPDRSKEFLALLGKYLHIKPLLVLREPVSFLFSYYQQNLKNPKMEMVTCYGQDWSFERMLNDPWFIRHIDYLSFVEELEALIGKREVTLFKYSKNIIDTLFNYLNIDIKQLTYSIPQNVGLSFIAIELLKKINQLDLTPKDKQNVIEKLMECDQILQSYHPKHYTNIESREYIENLFSLQRKVFEKYFHIKI